MSDTAPEAESANRDGSNSSSSAAIPANRHILFTAGPGHRHRWLRRLALASVIATFALIVLGGIVRVTGSGLGCAGEWPLCDGGLLPPLTKEDVIEYSHRLVASAIVGPLIFATFLVALLRYRRVPAVPLTAAAAVVLVLAQAGLGGVTVLTELPGHIVAAHLAMAQALLGCLILLAVYAYRVPEIAPETAPETVPDSAPAAAADAGENPPAAKKDGFPRLAAITAIATYLLLLSGAYVTATPGALAACAQWPLCDGFGWPSTVLQEIHMLHRVVAALVGLLILYTLYRAYRHGLRRLTGDGIVLMILAGSGAVIFLAQVLVGAWAIWTHFPVSLRAYHIALATAVWGIMVAVALLSRYEPAADTVEADDMRRRIVIEESQVSTANPETP